MTSFEVLRVQNGTAENVDSAEFSFMTDSHNENPTAIQPNGHFNLMNLPSSFMSSTHDLGVEEIHQRLVQLLQENQEMKEALKKNNAVMKEQMTTVREWCDRITQSKTDQNEKISSLENEKKELLETIKELEIKIKDFTPTITCNVEETTVRTDEVMGYEVVLLNEELNKEALKKALIQAAEFKKEIEELNINLKHQSIEFESLKKKCEQQTEMIKNQDEKQKQQEKADNLKLQISKTQLEETSSLLEKCKIRCDSLKQQADEYKTQLENIGSSDSDKVQQLKEEILNLKDVLQIEQYSNQVNRNSLLEAEKKLDQLMKDNERVNKLLEIQSRDQQTENDNLVAMKEMEAKKHFEVIDNLTAQLMNAEQTIEDKLEEVEKLTTDLMNVKADSEKIPVLEAQVEVYKTDLNNEMLAKVAAQKEVERLQNEIFILEERIPKKTHLTHVSAGSETPGASNVRTLEPDFATAQSREFQCPMCEMAFTDYQAVQNHANNCIDGSR